MPRLDKETKEQIKKLNHSDLQDIVLKLASKDKSVYDYILANYLDKEYGEKDLFEATKVDLEIIFQKKHKGYSEQLKVANMLGACIKRINEFTKISKNKVYEADLLFHLQEDYRRVEIAHHPLHRVAAHHLYDAPQASAFPYHQTHPLQDFPTLHRHD